MLIFDATNLDRRLGVAYELKDLRAATAIGKRCDDRKNFALAIDMFVYLVPCLGHRGLRHPGQHDRGLAQRALELRRAPAEPRTVSPSPSIIC